MERIRKLWRQEEQPYEPIRDDGTEEDDGPGSGDKTEHTFSYVDYSIFLLLGVAMLWAWNMFLAAGPYFQYRFRTSSWIFENFQAAEVSVSTVTNLVSMLVLTKLQAGASYPKRIVASLAINMATFTLLTVSTKIQATAGGYFGFLLVMIFTTSLATGFCQNGVFAYAAGFAESSYTQAIMTGQAIAGVMPCIAQIISVLSVRASDERPHPPQPPADGPEFPPKHPPGPPPVSPTAALAYFLTAAIITAITLVAFFIQLGRHRKPHGTDVDNTTASEGSPGERKSVPMMLLLRKLFWLAGGVFLTFAVTLASFPVFTQRILSVVPPENQTALQQPPVFIPLAFLMWNIGDLLGRLLTAVPSLTLTHRPRLVFFLSLLRIAWVGLYHLCNVRGKGAVIASDTFYLVVVQLLFGVTNGYLGSICMIGASSWVTPEEREAAGGFMGLCLVAGLAVGSLASFFAAGA